ncbi:MAG: Holliday junction branch migration protein RuvA [Actinobacteria bacterium]|nr:Holliday junction branch migration protein RuvA [Actinomycetota bacterium]
MIAELHGSVAQRRKDGLVVRVDGTGLALEVGVPARSMADAGAAIHLYTHLHMSADGPLLVGFESVGELTLFTHLIGVSGVGPRTALRVISAHPTSRLIAALDAEDVKAFEAVPGIGRKLASRIILELRGKLVPEEVAPGVPPASDGVAEAMEALLTLGYSRGEAQIALEQSAGNHLTVEQRIAAALRELGGRTGR